MNWEAYVEKEGKTDKGQMKRRLMEWGAAVELCERKRKEVEKVEKMKEEQKRLWGKNTSGEYENVLEMIEGQYDEEMRRIEGEIAEILRKKVEMDRMILQLGPEEQEFIGLRYEKGYGFDYIGMKMFISRATLFRMQDRILKKLLEVETL